MFGEVCWGVGVGVGKCWGRFGGCRKMLGVGVGKCWGRFGGCGKMLLTHRHSTLSFPRLAPDPSVWVCPGQPGSSSIVCVLVLDVSVRPCTKGVSLL